MPGGVRRLKRPGSLRGDAERRVQSHLALSDELPQRLALDEFGDQITPPVRPADLVNRDDVRMIARRDGPGPRDKAAHASLIAGDMAGNVSARPGVRAVSRRPR